MLLTALFWSLSALTCVAMLSNGGVDAGKNVENTVGRQYLAAAFPAVSRGSGLDVRETGSTLPEGSLIVNGNGSYEEDDAEALDAMDQENDECNILDSISSGMPLVLIYHTHATESYQPVSIGNFHSIEEKGTVREVGGVLKNALEAKGISVIHDKAIHDSPSYSKSYSRSLEAAKNIIATNPSIKIIIDLHRDAAAYKGNNKQVFAANDEQAAQFSLVVGEGNENVAALKEFADKINRKANELYPGFSKGVILKEFKYNQYIADDYLLLEMGNNQNNIEEARASAMLFADVIVEILREM